MKKSDKDPKDMTTEEMAEFVFPKKLKDKLKEKAHENDDKSDKQSS